MTAGASSNVVVVAGAAESVVLVAASAVVVAAASSSENRPNPERGRRFVVVCQPVVARFLREQHPRKRFRSDGSFWNGRVATEMSAPSEFRFQLLLSRFFFRHTDALVASNLDASILG